MPCELLFTAIEAGTLTTDVTEVDPLDAIQWAAVGIDPATIDFAFALDATPVWRIAHDAGFTGPVEITFHYDDDTLRPGAPETGLAVFHWNGGAWEQLATLSRDIAANRITVEATTFSPFVLGVRRSECSDGEDSDGDTKVDWPEDEGCRDLGWPTERPQCSNGGDDDGDGKIDHDGGPTGAPADPQCAGKPWRDLEAKSASECGLGAELALVGAALLVLARSRRRS
jgi:hypothetical protein